MFKKGIFNISQIISAVENKRFGKNPAIAIDLYEQAGELEQEKREAVEELILENFSFSDGSYKKTHSNRFDDFDKKIIAYLQKNLPANKKYHIHDLAVSDGRTALDFFQKLEKIFPDLDFFASDKNIFIEIFCDQKNKNKKIVKDLKGKILQLIFPPLVLNVYSSKRAIGYKIKKAVSNPLNFLATLLFLNPLAQKIFFKTKKDADKKITLLKKEVKKTAETKNNFHLIEYDILEKSFGEFDIVRAMNVINISYFTPREVKKIIANILSSLKEGGFFIVGSNKNAATPVDGDLMIKKNNRLESVMKFNNGAPFRETILSA